MAPTTPVSRPELRRLIIRLFRDGSPSAFRDQFLFDYFSTLYQQHGAATELNTLITALSTSYYQEDGSQIVTALCDHFTSDTVDAALRELRGVAAPPVKLPAPEAQSRPGPALALVRDRGEALGYMRKAHALVIGIGSYQYLRKLDNTRNDAQDIRAVLTDVNMCGYPREQVTLLLDAEATKPAIENALKELAARTAAESTVFIFAACHGGRIESGTFAGHYLLPVDARGRKQFGEAAFANSAISEVELSGLLSRIPARKLFVALDCCYAGGVVNLRSDDPEAAEADGQEADQAEGLVAELRKEVLDRLMSSGRGRVILAAANRQQTAKELLTDRNGLFTKYLLAGLKGAGGGAGPFVDVFEVYRYVHDSVSRVELPTAQTPVFKADLEGPELPVAVRSVQYFQ